MSAAQRRDASSQTAKSAPRSKRCEASVCMPSRFAPIRMRRRSKCAHFEQHVGGALRHFGVETAHDAGESDGARAIGDDQHLRVELALLAVERHHLLAGARAAHAELAAGNGGEIVGVQRLAALPETEVGGVDDVVDRARADRLEPAHQPLRRRADLHAADHPRDEARAAFGVVDLHGRPRTVRRKAFGE